MAPGIIPRVTTTDRMGTPTIVIRTGDIGTGAVVTGTIVNQLIAYVGQDPCDRRRTGQRDQGQAGIAKEKRGHPQRRGERVCRCMPRFASKRD
jgi:hypothetical protein